MLRHAFPRMSALVFLCLVGVAGVSVAHPGHGVEGGSYELSHYLTSPLHWTASLMAMALMLVTWIAARRFRGRFTSLGLMAGESQIPAQSN